MASIDRTQLEVQMRKMDLLKYTRADAFKSIYHNEKIRSLLGAPLNACSHSKIYFRRRNIHHDDSIIGQSVTFDTDLNFGMPLAASRTEIRRSLTILQNRAMWFND